MLAVYTFTYSIYTMLRCTAYPTSTSSLDTVEHALWTILYQIATAVHFMHSKGKDQLVYIVLYNTVCILMSIFYASCSFTYILYTVCIIPTYLCTTLFSNPYRHGSHGHPPGQHLRRLCGRGGGHLPIVTTHLLLYHHY